MRWWCAGGLVVLVVSLCSGSVFAGPVSRPPASVLMDATSGQILQENDAESVRPAGSLYQLMVLLLTLEQSDLGTMPLQAPVTVSDAVALSNATLPRGKAH